MDDEINKNIADCFDKAFEDEFFGGLFPEPAITTFNGNVVDDGSNLTIEKMIAMQKQFEIPNPFGLFPNMNRFDLPEPKALEHNWDMRLIVDGVPVDRPRIAPMVTDDGVDITHVDVHRNKTITIYNGVNRCVDRGV